MSWRRFFWRRREATEPPAEGEGVRVFDLSVAGTSLRLRKLGVHCSGAALARGNVVHVPAGPALGRKVKIDFASGRNNVIHLGQADRHNGVILVAGSDNVFRNAGRPSVPRGVLLHVRFNGDRNTVEVGPGVTSNGTTIVVSGPGSTVRIGRDCMFSSGIWLRAADMHAVIDLDSRAVINPPGDITLGDHVWIGQDAMILKDVTLGSGSVVAAKALVNRSCAPHSLVAGVPGRVVRERVVWSRKPHPRPQDIDDALALCGAEASDA